VSGFDLVRLCRGLGVPWDRLVELRHTDFPAFDGFRLDAGPRHHHFVLRRRENGACLLLVEIDDKHRRCGVHALRPDACRRYPLVLDGSGAISLAEHARCPEPQARAYAAGAEDLRAAIAATEEERALYAIAVARWDQRARTASMPLAPSLFLTWIGAVSDALAGIPRDRQETVIIDTPLPS
jgi:Fe-S-cluster containining protein